MLAHLPLVRILARALFAKARGIPEHRFLDLDDLISAGTIGLLEAATRFDADRGVPFGAYCRRRIHGSMIVALRQTGLSRAEWLRLKAGAVVRTFVPLDTAYNQPSAINLQRDLETTDAIEKIRTALRQLPTRERLVIRMLVAEHSQRAIAPVLGVTPGRISQIQMRAQQRLRQALRIAA